MGFGGWDCRDLLWHGDALSESWDQLGSLIPSDLEKAALWGRSTKMEDPDLVGKPWFHSQALPSKVLETFM